MAITLSETPGQKKVTQERTFELTVRNRLGEPTMILARREQVETEGERTRLITNMLKVKRSLADVKNQEIDLVGQVGVKVTVNQLWKTMIDLLDRWSIEDKTPPAPTP
jgi:hypothetical protein